MKNFKKLVAILCVVMCISLAFMLAACVDKNLGEQVGKVELTIDCVTILDNMDKLDQGVKDSGIVPEDGIVFEDDSVKIYQNDNLYLVLERICKKKKIRFDAKNSAGFGYYITGIANINENDCGKGSGWIYLVNGKMPETAMDKTILKDGDKVRIAFTCVWGDIEC